MGSPNQLPSPVALSIDVDSGFPAIATLPSARYSLFSSGPLCQCLLSLATLTCMAWIVFEFRDSIYHVLLWVEKQDTWMICFMFAALFTVVSLPLTWGYILLNLACGYLFGVLSGIFVVVTTATIGVLVAHLIVRQFCSSFIASRLLSSHGLRAFLYVISGPQAFKVVTCARLTPIPFGLQNAIFAASTISLGQYLAATVIGLLPTQIINIYLGSTLRSMQDVLTDDNTATVGYIVFSVQIAISLVLMAFVVRRARQELNRIMELNSDSIHSIEKCVSDKT